MKIIISIALSIILCIFLASCTASPSEIQSDDALSVSESENIFSSETIETSFEEEFLISQTVFPYVWRDMNAVIVSWGAPNGLDYDNDTGTEIEFVKIFFDTMEYSLIHDDECDYEFFSETTGYSFVHIDECDYSFEEELIKQDFIFVPDDLIEYVTEGETALVFMGGSGTIYYVDDNGEYLWTLYFFPVVIFPITDGVISVTDEIYDEAGLIKYYLTKGNTFMERNYPDVDIRYALRTG